MSSAELAHKRTLRRLNIHYTVIQYLINVVYLAVVGFASVFLRYRGLNDMQIGLLLALGTVLSIITQPVLGALADRMKNIRLGTVTALFHGSMVPLALFLTVYSKNVTCVAIAFALLRYLISASDPFENSMAMEMTNYGYPVNFAMARGISSIGYASGSFLLGKAVTGWGEQIIMPCVVLLAIPTTLSLFTFRVPAGAKLVAEAQNEKNAKTLGLFAFVRENLRFCLFIVSVALLFYSHEARANYLYQIIVHIGGNADQFGTLCAFTATIEMPGLLCFSLLLKRFKARSLMRFSAVFMVLRILIVCYAPNLLWMYVSACLQVLSYGLFVPASIYYVNEVIGEANRNKGQTFLSMGMCVSAVMGTMIGGTMLNAADGNPHNMLLVGTIIAAVGAVILFFVLRPTKRCTDPQAAGRQC